MNFKYLKNLLLEKKWFFVLYICALIMTDILSALLFNPEYASFRNSQEIIIPIVISIFIYFIFMSLLTIHQFNFFHIKNQVDFYHSLPIKRQTIFITNLFVIPILFTLPFILNGCFIISFFNFDNINSINAEYNYALAKNLIVNFAMLSMLIYSFIVLCSTFTGKAFSHIVVCIITFATPIILVLFTILITTHTINEGINADLIAESILRFTFMLNSNFTFEFIPPIFCSQIIISIIFLTLSVILYKNFKSESANKLFVNIKLSNIYTVISSFVFAVFITAICMLIYHGTPQSNIFFILLFVVLILIGYFTTSIIFNGLNNKYKLNIKLFCTTIILTVVYISVVFLDVTNISSKLPISSDVETAYVNGYPFYGDNINIISELNRTVLKNYSICPTSDMPNRIEFEYDNKRRVYYISEDTEVYDTLNILFTSANFKQNYINFINEFRTHKDASATISIGYNSINITNPEIFDALILDIQNDDEFGLYNEQQMAIGNVSLDSEYDSLYWKKYYTLMNFYIKPSYINTLKLAEQQYKFLNGSNSSLMDNFSVVTFVDSNLAQNKETILNNSDGGYMSTKILLSNISSKTTTDTYNYAIDYKSEPVIYSYEGNKEELIEFLNTSRAYYSPNNEIVKVDDDKEIYTTLCLYPDYPDNSNYLNYCVFYDGISEYLTYNFKLLPFYSK